MRGYINVTSCLLVLSMLTGCGLSDPTGAGDIKVQIKEMNLDGAKAMAHLQSGNSGTKASMEFNQEDALYLVYDNNEIRLPEIKFTVEFPDSYSERDKKELKEYVSVTIEEPKIKDFGKYIYVYSSLIYKIDIPDWLTIPHAAHSHMLVRKSDGLCMTVDENVGEILYHLYEGAATVMEDSQGRCYVVSKYDAARIIRLSDTDGGVEISYVDAVDKDGALSRLPRLQVCNDIVYIACMWFIDDGFGYPLLPDFTGGTALAAVSPDYTCERTYFEGGVAMMGFEKYGNDAYLFVCEDPIITGSAESDIKVYKVTSGCELVASTTVTDAYSDLGQLLSSDDGVFTYCCQGAIVKFDAKSAECTATMLDESIRGHVRGATFIGGKYYHVHSPEGSGYVEVLKIDVLTESVEQLKKFDVPAGCRFSGRLNIADESKGRLNVVGYFNKTEDGMFVEEVSVDVFDPEIAKAYADEVAAKNYGIDFGSYKVVTVVPLDESLEPSGN